jgi:hypothetical protein
MGNYLWNDSVENHKYHLANWELVSMSKEQGGLGLPSLRDLNISLLASWLKRYNKDKDKLWTELIDHKYDTVNPNIFMSKTVGASSFFKGFMWAAQAAKMGYKWKVGNGKRIRLWEDNWLGSSSLAIQFWPLYRIVNEKGKTLAELWDGINLKCTFRRSISESLYQSWLEVVELVATVQFTEEADEMVWQFSSSGIYSSQSLYRIINFRGIMPVHVSAVWSLKIPPRVHFFLWLVIKNRALTRDNLAKRRNVEDENCLLEKESIHHVFFDCVVAKQCWCIMSDILGCSVGENMTNVGKYSLSNKKHCLVNMVSSAVIWSIWKLRNDLCFQRYGWRSMEMLLFRISGLLVNWTILCPEDKRGMLAEYINKIKTAAGMMWLPYDT